MSDETTRKIIAKAMPKARIIERAAATKDAPTPLADALTPDTAALVRKYGGNLFLRSGVGTGMNELPSQDAGGPEDSIESAEVEVESGSKRVSRRVLLIDKGKKRIIGISG